LRRPAVRLRSVVVSSTLLRTKLLLRPPGCSDATRAQATLASVAASSGGGATRCRSSSSWCPIRLHASCRSRADTAADVAKGRSPCAFQLPGLPSPSAAHHPAAVLGQKLLILCTRAPRRRFGPAPSSTTSTTSTSTSATSALRGNHLHELLQSKHSHRRSDCGGDISIVLQSIRSCCYRYDCEGMLEYIW